MTNQGLATKNLLQLTDSGDIGLDRAAVLAGRSGGDGLRFTFEYGGFLFGVRARAQHQTTEMRFHANLGSLPYTAEDPQARHDAMAVLRSAGRALGGRVVMTPEQRVMLRETVTLDEPFTPVLLMSRAAKLLVVAKPYLELLGRYINPPRGT